MVALGLDMHLGDQRAGGIEDEHARRGRLPAPPWHAMRRKHHGRIGLGDLVELLHKNGALGLQALHHGAVVHDLVAHIDRRAVLGERQLDDLDGPSTPAQKPRGAAR